MQLVAFEIGFSTQHVCFGFPHVVSRLDTRQRQVYPFRWAVCARFLFISHVGQLPVAGTMG